MCGVGAAGVPDHDLVRPIEDAGDIESEAEHRIFLDGDWTRERDVHDVAIGRDVVRVSAELIRREHVAAFDREKDIATLPAPVKTVQHWVQRIVRAVSRRIAVVALGIDSDVEPDSGIRSGGNGAEIKVGPVFRGIDEPDGWHRERRRVRTEQLDVRNEVGEAGHRDRVSPGRAEAHVFESHWLGSKNVIKLEPQLWLGRRRARCRSGERDQHHREDDGESRDHLRPTPEALRVNCRRVHRTRPRRKRNLRRPPIHRD